MPHAGPARRYREGDLIADKYQLVRLMGEGGMGAVWIAHNLALDVQVALKLIRAEAASPDTSGRLLQEARAAARLGHPGIVRVFDFGRTVRDEPFIVMELLDGESLADALGRRKRISATRAVQMLLPIADALSCAHAKGIVHRDLKPDNVFLHRGESGRTQPKVVDFGIALLEREVDRRITEDGAVLGSPSYMSPEQARGEEQIDHRADIWSLAVVLYETMTGEPPFSGPNNLAILRQVVEQEPVPVTELGAGDDALWAIIERALRKDRAERWQSARALGSALALWLVHQGIEEDVCGASLTATWLSTEGRKDVLSSRPPPPPGDASQATPTSLRAPALPSLPAVEAPPVSFKPRRRKLLPTLLGIVLLALVVGGFVVTRNVLIARNAAAPPPAPALAAAPAPADAPVLKPPADPVPTPPADTQEPAQSTDVSELPVEPGQPLTKTAPKPRVVRPKRASSSAARNEAAASDLKMPY